MAGPDIAFWQDRYLTRRTPWDDGEDDPELLAWLADGTLSASDAPVLVPGCGSGRDLAVLAARGIEVIGLDYAPAAVVLSRERLANACLQARVEQDDVLSWSQPSPIGAVMERTCLCALHPDHWVRYAQQLHAWLRPGGRGSPSSSRCRGRRRPKVGFKGRPTTATSTRCARSSHLSDGAGRSHLTRPVPVADTSVSCSRRSEEKPCFDGAFRTFGYRRAA